METSDGDLVHVTVDFDPDDVDAAFAELDARYLAGEAAAHAQTWLIAQVYRRVQPTRVSHDDDGLGEHRPPAGGSVRAGDMTHTSVPRGTSSRTPCLHSKRVHRLTDLGAVILRGTGTPQRISTPSGGRSTS